MKSRFLAKRVGKIGCALVRESAGLIIFFGCLLTEANEKKLYFRWIKSEAI